jgi:ribonucleoside-diphosphate reductase alpha chain
MASTSLRAGVPPEQVVDQLENIQSPKGAFDQQEQIASIPDGIATAIERHLEDPSTDFGDSQASVENAAEESVTLTNGGAVKELVDRGESPECPSCGEMALIFQEGCKECESCGWSEC